MIHVTEVVEVTDEIVAAFATIIPQLSSPYDSYEPDDRGALAALAASEHTQLFVARDTDTGEVVGTLTLVLFQLPTGFRGAIEDVVVAEHRRGHGVGEALVRHALDRAARAGARSIRLTSRPTRTEADRLYRRLGFRRRETNVYELPLSE